MAIKIIEILNHKRNDNKIFPLFLVIASLMAGAISLWIGLQQSVWFDEAYSILVAKQPVSDLIRLVSLDTHPPLYYLILKAWGSAFGWSELALRSLSVLALVGSISIGGLLVRRLFSTRIAIGAVLLLMVSPLLIRYGFEIRMYSIASLIGISATYVLYVTSQARSKNAYKFLVLYGLLVVVGMYTLYYLALLWIAHVVWLLYIHRRHHKPGKDLSKYVITYAGAALFFLPWLMTFIKQMSNGALAPIGQPMTLENLISVLTFNSVYQPLYQIDIIKTFVLLAVVSILIWAVMRARTNLSRYKDETALLAIYIIVPILILTIVSLFRSMYVERYLAHVAIGLLLLIGVILTSAVISSKSTKQKTVTFLIVYGTFLMGIFQLAQIGNFNFQRWQVPTVNQVAHNITAQSNNSLILAADPYVATELSYYLTNQQVFFVSPWPTLGGGYAPLSSSPFQVKNTAELTAKHITYVYYDNAPTLPSSYHVTSGDKYGSLNVTHYSR